MSRRRPLSWREFAEILMKSNGAVLAYKCVEHGLCTDYPHEMTKKGKAWVDDRKDLPIDGTTPHDDSQAKS